MIEAKIEVDNIADIERRLGKLKNKAPSVMSRAINRTLTNIKKNMASETASKYYVTNADVRKTISTTSASKNRLSGMAVSKSSPIALSKFKVSPNRPVRFSKGGKPSPKAYKAGVKKSESIQTMDNNPKAFIAIMQSGHVGMFIRMTNAERTRRGKTARNAIKQLFGPSVPQMINNEGSMKHINEEANSTLSKRIDAEINNILRRG